MKLIFQELSVIGRDLLALSKLLNQIFFIANYLMMAG